MTYEIGRWNVRCVSYTTTATTASGIVKVGYGAPAIGRGYSVEVSVAVWNKSTRRYTIYFFATTLLS
ncbi:hypothetical protein [Clostridium oryzae]|uniref:Uncharacterized protein n=1 Tax=Clostridium oryzae TaxID=1450648 RepID=A0A1V4ILH4_9CLOT|nr:hypothetical protein [Clostridium oryzae]OPJ60670.1 hypothetical protein CLORY_27210 [Clostridium oryzae]